MNDCLAATGSTMGLHPFMGALVLLLLGAGLAVLAWRYRTRVALGIALLPVIVGALLFSGLSAPPAQAAPCAPPAVCEPGEAIESVAVSGARFEFGLDEGGLYPVFTLTGGGGDELMAFHEAAEEVDATYVLVLTVANDVGTIVFSFDDEGYLVSAVPALPPDFTGGDVYTLIYETLRPSSAFVPAELVMSITYTNGCEELSASATVTGGLITYL